VKIESSVFREGVKALPLIAFGMLRDLPQIHQQAGILGEGELMKDWLLRKVSY
jgi:hypothetical protein